MTRKHKLQNNLSYFEQSNSFNKANKSWYWESEVRRSPSFVLPYLLATMAIDVTIKADSEPSYL